MVQHMETLFSLYPRFFFSALLRSKKGCKCVLPRKRKQLVAEDLVADAPRP